MDSIRLMMEEHGHINRMIRVIRALCCGMLEGQDVPAEDLREILDFLRRYADRHHHGKEEAFLFPAMVEHLGPAARNLINHGMLVEHDLGRSHVAACEAALDRYETDPATEHRLDVLAEIMGYAHVLTLHTEKEDTAVYPFARRKLDPAVLAGVDRRCEEYEAGKLAEGFQAKYLGFLAAMEGKYL